LLSAGAPSPPAERAYSAPQTPLVVIKGPISKGSEEEEKGGRTDKGKIEEVMEEWIWSAHPKIWRGALPLPHVDVIDFRVTED